MAEMRATEEESLAIIPLFLNTLAIALHCLGVYLLTCFNTNRSIQDVVILNLSIAEILISCCDITQNILTNYNVNSSKISYLIIAECSFLLLPSFMIMMVLTVNRFLEVYLSIHYNRLVTKKIVCKALLACWGMGMACGIATLAIRTSNENIAAVFFKYILPSVEGIVLLTALTVYLYIWKLFRRRNSSHAANEGFFQRNFFPPFLIIISFCIFVIAPDVTNLILIYILNFKNPNITNTLLIFYGVGFICDALIYIFLQAHLRNRLKNRLKQMREKLLSMSCKLFYLNFKKELTTEVKP